MKNVTVHSLSEMWSHPRLRSYLALFLFAQVFFSALFAMSTFSFRPVGIDRSWIMSKDLESFIRNKLSRKIVHEELAVDATRQLQFVQNEFSWIAQVYHEENFPALEPPQEAFNESVPVTDFCFPDESTRTARYTVLKNAMLVNGQLLLPESTNCSRIALNATLMTSFNRGQNSTPSVQARIVPGTNDFEDFESSYSCHERVYEPSVLFSFINWPQHGHALFNTLSLLWEAFGNDETGPLSRAGKNVRLYAYGDGLDSGNRQEWQQYLPFFKVGNLQPFMSMFTHQPVRSLANLLMASERHPICFTHLVVGISGGSLDHYNFDVPLSRWREFAVAVREHFGVPDTPRVNYGPPLERVAPTTGVANNNVSGLPEIRPVDWKLLPDRPRLVIVDRRDNRLILNVQQIRHIAMDKAYFRDIRVVYFEEMALEEQIRMLGETDVLLGMDGTGLMNGLFMPEGGIVVHIRPYGSAEFLPTKGDNFDRMWSANPGRVIRYESGDIKSTRFPTNLPELPELVFNHSSTIGYRFPFILRQDTIIDPTGYSCILDSCNDLLHGVPVDWQQHYRCTKSVFRDF